MSAEPPFNPIIPPTQPIPVVPLASRPSWPIVIGVCMVIYGGLFAVCGVIGLLMILFNPVAHVAPQPVAMPQSPLIIGSNIVSMLMLVILMALGVGLLARRRWSAAALRLWGMGQIVIGLAGMAIGYSENSGAWRTMAQSNTAGASGPRMVGMAVGVCFGACLVLAVPAFLLIWFSRPTIKAEVASWN